MSSSRSRNSRRAPTPSRRAPSASRSTDARTRSSRPSHTARLPRPLRLIALPIAQIVASTPSDTAERAAASRRRPAAATASVTSAARARLAPRNAANAPGGATVSTVEIRNGPVAPAPSCPPRLAASVSTTRRKLCIDDGVVSTIQRNGNGQRASRHVIPDRDRRFVHDDDHLGRRDLGERRQHALDERRAGDRHQRLQGPGSRPKPFAPPRGNHASTPAARSRDRPFRAPRASPAVRRAPAGTHRPPMDRGIRARMNLTDREATRSSCPTERAGRTSRSNESPTIMIEDGGSPRRPAAYT